MTHMMDLLLDLSDRVKAAETQKSSQEESSPASPSTQRTARWVWHQSTPTNVQQVSTAVRMKVARRMRELPLGKEMASDKGLDNDEDQHITHICRPLKSGLDRTGATTVVKNIT